MDIYGRVTAISKGTAVIKAYVFGSTPQISDTVTITVIESGSSQEPSQYEIGSIQLNPGRVTLEQDAAFPTSVTATVYDKSGRLLSNETVDWNIDGLSDATSTYARATKIEGNTIYLEGVDAGRGELVASRESSDGTVKSASAYVVTGGIITPDEEYISSISFTTSSPQYLVAGDGKKVESLLKYVPASKKGEGVLWSAKNAAGFISYSTTNEGIVVEGLNATEKDKDPVVTATTLSKDSAGNSLTANQSYRCRQFSYGKSVL